MNTLLATGDAPLSPGFLAWREMCAHKPEYDVGACSRAATRT
jgi:tRNA(adenine34) deaminase